MSKLGQLIEELCSDGVEYKPLAKVAKISNGKDHKHLEDGDIPVYGSGGIMRYANQSIYNEVSVLIPRKGSIGNIFYVDKPFWSVDTIFYTKIDFNQINARFLFHYLLTQDIEKLNTAGGVPSLTKAVLDKIQIPVPPLSVQCEIVRILDNFTELTAELTAELTDRKKQYEYYMESLLNSSRDITMELIGDIFSTVTDYVAAGSFASIAENVIYKNDPDYAQLVRTMDIKSAFTKGNNVYVDKTAFDFLWRVNLDEESIIMPNIGVNCGEVYYVEPENLPYENNVLGPNAILLRSDRYNNKYLYYLLNTHAFQKTLKVIISPGGQTKFNKTGLKNLKLPIPYADDLDKSLAEQQRVVELLDRFDILCNDIVEGLPAEIDERQKQYEYYRDKLLTFKNIDGEV